MFGLVKPSASLARRTSGKKSFWCRLLYQRCTDYLQVEDLLLEADVGSNFEMDKVLMKACLPVVQTACKNVRAGDARYEFYC